jgi:hypothetical protein
MGREDNLASNAIVDSELLENFKQVNKNPGKQSALIVSTKV